MCSQLPEVYEWVSMHVYVCVYISSNIHLALYLCKQTWKYKYMYANICTQLLVCVWSLTWGVWVHELVSVHVRMCVCVYVSSSIHSDLYLCTQTWKYTQICKHRNIYVQRQNHSYTNWTDELSWLIKRDETRRE